MTNDQFIDWLHGYMVAAPHLLPKSVRDELTKLVTRRNVPRVLPNPIVISKKEAPQAAPYIPGRLPNQVTPAVWPRHEEWMNRPFLEGANDTTRTYEAKPFSPNPRNY